MYAVVSGGESKCNSAASSRQPTPVPDQLLSLPQFHLQQGSFTNLVNQDVNTHSPGGAHLQHVVYHSGASSDSFGSVFNRSRNSSGDVRSRHSSGDPRTMDAVFHPHATANKDANTLSGNFNFFLWKHCTSHECRQQPYTGFPTGRRSEPAIHFRCKQRQFEACTTVSVRSRPDAAKYYKPRQ